MVRDYALAASGLLVGKIGGPSVRPYQPDGVWEAVAMPGSNTRDYRADSGENLYRRSMYTFWKRAAPPASMEIFNAPTREVVHRPPRADRHAAAGPGDAQRPAVRGGGAAVGGNSDETGGDNVDARIDFTAWRLLARPLQPQELAVVRGASIRC